MHTHPIPLIGSALIGGVLLHTPRLLPLQTLSITALGAQTQTAFVSHSGVSTNLRGLGVHPTPPAKDLRGGVVKGSFNAPRSSVNRQVPTGLRAGKRNGCEGTGTDCRPLSGPV